MKKPIVYFDMDGVLVDLKGGVLDLVHHLGLPAPTSLNDVFKSPEYRRAQEHMETSQRFWEKLQPLPEGLDAFERVVASCNVEVRVASSPAFPMSASPKLAWCEQYLNLPPANVVLITKKEALAADNTVLIDDSADNCAKFEKAGGNALLVVQPWSFYGELYQVSSSPRMRITTQESLCNAVGELDYWIKGVPF